MYYIHDAPPLQRLIEERKQDFMDIFIWWYVWNEFIFIVIYIRNIWMWYGRIYWYFIMCCIYLCIYGGIIYDVIVFIYFMVERVMDNCIILAQVHQFLLVNHYYWYVFFIYGDVIFILNLFVFILMCCNIIWFDLWRIYKWLFLMGSAMDNCIILALVHQVVSWTVIICYCKIINMII